MPNPITHIERRVNDLDERVSQLRERVDRIETHVSNIEIENRYTRETLGEVRVDLKGLRKLAERAIGAGVALGVVWTVVTFVVALLMRR